jgi:hypothetical protein
VTPAALLALGFEHPGADPDGISRDARFDEVVVSDRMRLTPPTVGT